MRHESASCSTRAEPQEDGLDGLLPSHPLRPAESPTPLTGGKWQKDRARSGGAPRAEKGLMRVVSSPLGLGMSGHVGLDLSYLSIVL